MQDEFDLRDATGEQPPERRSALFRALLSLQDLWQRALGVHLLWAILFLGVGTWTLVPGGTFFAPQIHAGEIAHRDYVAPRELLVPDEEATAQKRARAREAVLPVYDLDVGYGRELDRQLAALFASERRRLEREGEEEPQLEPAADGEEQAPAEGLRLTEEQLDVLAAKGFSAELEEQLRALVQTILSRGVVANKNILLQYRDRGIVLRDLETGEEQVQLDLYDFLSYPDEVRDVIASELRGTVGYSVRERRQLRDLVLSNIAPNVHPNRSETLSRQEAAAAAAEQVFNQVHKGQIIVRKGDEIRPGDARIVNGLRGNRRLEILVLTVLGSFLLAALAELVLWSGFRRGGPAGKARRQLVAELLLLLTLALLGVRLGVFVSEALAGAFGTAPLNLARTYQYAIPVASLALVATLLYSRSVALLLSLVFAVLAGRIMGGEAMGPVVFTLAGSLAAIFSLDRTQFKQRSVLTRAGLAIGVANGVAILMLGALAGTGVDEAAQLGLSAAMGVVGGMLCAATASFTVPILESLLSVTTDIKLVELANTNLPLLKRLAFEAPGTFQHSLMVANLAKAGCEAVGSESVLAYTGGLYHDVGKIVRPEYFIENQRPGHNPHDPLPPAVSAEIVVSHITDGLELAREHRLPPPVCDAIEQHHGTRVMTYFLSRAVEQAREEDGTVSEEEFRYPGPKPQSKVIGILMLADAVEAASRTLAEPTPERIQTVIQAIVDDCMADGQLDETDLTLADFGRVTRAFRQVLSTIYHRRIDYPGFDFNRETEAGGGRERTVTASRELGA